VGWELFRLYRQAGNPQHHLLAGIGFSLFVAWTIGSIADNVIAQTVFQVYFWSLLATVSAVTFTEPNMAESLSMTGQEPGYGLGLRVRRWAAAIAQRMPMDAQTKDSRPASASEVDKGTELPRCPRCQTPPLTPADIFCRRCFTSMLAPGPLLSLILLIFVLVGGIGFYLWNQGAGLETFFVGWLLLYVLLATLLRNQKPRYIYAILSFSMVGLISAQLLFRIPVRSFRVISQLSILGLLALGLYGFGASWWVASRFRNHSRLPRFYARHYLLPLGTLFGTAYTLNFVLQESSSFIYGRPLALGYILAGLLALFAELWLVIWGITGERWEAALRSLAICYGSVLGLIQIAVLVSAGALETVAKLLPVFSATERFAPLLLERQLGFYTWVMLGLMITIGTSLIIVRRRFLTRDRPADSSKQP